MLEYSTGAYSWWIIRQYPTRAACEVVARVAATCVLGTGSCLGGNQFPPRPQPPALPACPFCGFHTTWQEQWLFSHRCPPLPQDSFRNKTGEANHPQTNRVPVLCTTRWPSATNYLFPLIQSLLSYREENDKAVCQYQTHHSRRLRLASSGSWQTGLGAIATTGPVPGRQPCWQEALIASAPRTRWGTPCTASSRLTGRLVQERIPEAEGKRTYLVMLWGPSPHSRKKHQLQTSSPLSQPPLPLSPVKEKERAAIKRNHRSRGTRPVSSPES